MQRQPTTYDHHQHHDYHITARREGSRLTRLACIALHHRSPRSTPAVPRCRLRLPRLASPFLRGGVTPHKARPSAPHPAICYASGLATGTRNQEHRTTNNSHQAAASAQATTALMCPPVSRIHPVQIVIMHLSKSNPPYQNPLALRAFTRGF